MGWFPKIKLPDSARSVGVSLLYEPTGFWYDFTAGTFQGAPAVPIHAMAEYGTPWLTVYHFELVSTPRPTFADGPYAMFYHDMAAANAVLAISEGSCYAGEFRDWTAERAMVEATRNMLQALSLMLAEATGDVSGSAQNAETIKDHVSGETRLAATTTTAGDRTMNVLTPYSG